MMMLAFGLPVALALNDGLPRLRVTGTMLA